MFRQGWPLPWLHFALDGASTSVVYRGNRAVPCRRWMNGGAMGDSWPRGLHSVRLTKTKRGFELNPESFSSRTSDHLLLSFPHNCRPRRLDCIGLVFHLGQAVCDAFRPFQYIDRSLRVVVFVLDTTVIKPSIPLTPTLFQRCRTRSSLALPPNSTVKRSNFQAAKEVQVTELYER